MEIRTVNKSESDLIEILFREVYEKEQGIHYWKWCFNNPYGYINSGMFKDNKLIGYYACHLTKNSGCVVSAMVHPEYRKQGIFMKLSEDLHSRLSYFRDYVYLFSNKLIRPIHLEKEGYKEAYQIKEYRIPVNTDIHARLDYTFNPIMDFYEAWRYVHPLRKYYRLRHLNNEKQFTFNIYEDRLQIVEYDDIDYTLRCCLDIVKNEKKENVKSISFWSEEELDYPYIVIPTWKQYKIFNKKSTFNQIMENDTTKMCMSDVY